MNNKALIKKLNNAYVTCNECGMKYGDHVITCSSMWEDTCDVCGLSKVVTETRDYNYFRRGILRLSMEQAEES